MLKSCPTLAIPTIGNSFENVKAFSKLLGKGFENVKAFQNYLEIVLKM